MLDIKPETILSIENGIVLRSLPESNQYYAFNTVTGDHFSLNHTGFWVLDKLNQPIELFNLESAYIETFSIRRSLGTKHLKEVIAFSLENALIKEVNP